MAPTDSDVRTIRVRRITAREDLVVVEVSANYDGGPWMYGVQLLEFRDGKVVRERIYGGEAWEAPSGGHPGARTLLPTHRSEAHTSPSVPGSGRGCVPGVGVPLDLPFVHQMDAWTASLHEDEISPSTLSLREGDWYGLVAYRAAYGARRTAHVPPRPKSAVPQRYDVGLCDEEPF